jgi:hypothetical protein
MDIPLLRASLAGMYPTGVRPMGVPFIGVHSMGASLIGVHMRSISIVANTSIAMERAKRT